MIRYAFSVQYDGRRFHGMQRQVGFRSIQEEIEKALFTILRIPIRIHYAGRTDSGVHAVAQVIHFDSPQKLELRRFIYGLNSILPKQISFIHGAQVPATFHARFSCLSREYIYWVTNSPFWLALHYQKSLWVRFPLDILKMQEAANYLRGEHDFAAFTKEMYLKKGEKTIRRLDFIRIYKQGCELFFHFKGSGFLHNMIRIIMGTLLQVGMGEVTPETLEYILKTKNRKKAGKTVPATALYFYRAHYEEYQTPPELFMGFLGGCFLNSKA